MRQLTPLAANHEQERILLVDDDPADLQVLLQTLRGRGYQLLTARNGSDALKTVRRASPTLMLLDIVMPDLDGYEVCKRLKDNQATSNVIVIFLSAMDDIRDRVCGPETGAVDHITKPFRAEEVVTRVETHLRIHRLECLLARQNARLEARHAYILESMPEGVIGINDRGRITFVNPAVSQLTGWEMAELIDADAHSLLMPRSADGAIRSREDTALYATLTENSSRIMAGEVFWRRNETSFPVEYSCTPCPQEGEAHGAVLVFRDVTGNTQHRDTLQKLRNELQEQQDKLIHMSRLGSMGEMAAGLAHEVNQPLTAINNYVQMCLRLMQRDPVKMTSVRNGLQEISIHARRAGDIITRIRNFVKKTDHCLQVVDCNQLMQDVVHLAETDARHNSMEIHLDLAENILAIKVDPIQIQQVALNLIRNGMEAMCDMPHRNIGLWVRTEQLKPGWVRVAVIDRGYGLADDAGQEVFSPFYTTRDDGMGIGLSVCHSIIQAHGGTLDFIRNPEGGTTFWFTIPMAEV